MAQDPRYIRGVPTVTWRPWVAKRWRFSTTVGHGFAFHPKAGGLTEYHEFVHIDTYEDLCILGAVLGGLLCIVSWKAGLILWCSSGAPWLLPNFITGWIRFGDAYYGSSHERFAYAATKVEVPNNGRPFHATDRKG
jgi:hypothetical protein